uniref:Calmodulin-binding domain-containing protein n=1 Tax=Leersia perrieri TaxID=77586 RepID=A0A0D9VR42_9ORYZ
MSKVLERRNSFGGSTPTSSASDSRKDEKKTPHYLRASTGSCHDLCKYGHKSPFEEEKKFSTSGGRRKKLPSHLTNLILHRSAILDRSRDARHRNISLDRSSISLGESDRIAPKKTADNSTRGVTSSDHLVPGASSSADPKNVNFDLKKKQPTVLRKTSADTKSSSGGLKFDKKSAVNKLKLTEMPQLEKSKTMERVTTVKHSSVKRPTSLPTKLNLIKQVPVPSHASSHLLSSKAKRNVKGEITSLPATVTGVHGSNSGKTGRSPMSSSSSINGKEVLNMSRSSFSVESKMGVSVVKQEDDVQDSNMKDHVEPTLRGMSSDTTECFDESRPGPEEAIMPVSGDNEMKGNQKHEASGSEGPLQSSIVVDLLQPSDDQKLKSALSKYLEAEDSQTDDVSSCQLFKKSIAVETAAVGDSLSTENVLEIEANEVKVNTSMGSQFSEGNEEGAHEGLQESIEHLALREKHAEEHVPFLGSTSGYTVEDVKADEIFEGWTNNIPSHCQPISETSSDGELLEDPKSVQIEPRDSTLQSDGLVISASGTSNAFEQDKVKPGIFVQQSPEELSEDEFYEEYDFELSESDDTGTEDEAATINKNSDDRLNADGQRQKRISTLEHDDASSTPYKLKFKRGKIVELQPDSNNGPRRLKFRRRSVSEVSSSEGQSARRIYRRNSTKDTGPSNLDVESPGVKLRHQDTQEKKDAQGLFNNMIEETASKLVESRKSKVKALVGAFETVILLQDGKPTSSTPQADNSPHSFQDDEGTVPEQVA